MTRYVFLHGFMGSPKSWESVVQFMKIGAGQTLLPLAGHDPSVPVPDSFEEEADRIASELERLGGPIHLVGYSLGGRLALAALLRHPALFHGGPVRFLTLIGANPGIDDAERAARETSDAEWSEKLLKDFDGFLEDWRQQPVFSGLADRIDSEVLDLDRQSRKRHDPAALAEALKTLGLGRMPDYRSELGQLELPVSLVVGELDEKFWSLCRPIASRLPLGAIHVVPEVGHNVLLEAPEALARILVPLRETTLTDLDSTSLRLGEIQAELDRRSKG